MGQHMVRTLTGFEPAPPHLHSHHCTGDTIIVGGEEWRYSHPVHGSHIGKKATIIRTVCGIGAGYILVCLDANPSIRFGMRKEDIIVK